MSKHTYTSISVNSASNKLSSNTSSNLPTLQDVLGAPLSEADALIELQKDYDTYQIFLTFSADKQKEIISFLCGQRGLPITYDTFFKKS